MAKRVSSEPTVQQLYRTLLRTWGPQHWWPAASRFEVIMGAFLTQNTSWRNVDLALKNLRRVGALNVAAIRRLPLRDLEQLVRPAGYFRQKAARLKGFVQYLDRNHRGSLSAMFARPTEQLRAELLALNGIGPETADSILLYAGNHPVFVVDGYARRIFERHGLVTPAASYDQLRTLVQKELAGLPAKAVRSGAEPTHRPSRMSRSPRSAAAQHFNEMHGLLVTAGKLYCHKTQHRCTECPLACFLKAPLSAV